MWGLLQEQHSSGAYEHEEFFWLDGICCPKCSLDVPYLPSVPRNLLVGLLRRASQVKRVGKKSNSPSAGWFCCLSSQSCVSFLAKSHLKLSQTQDVVEELEAAKLGPQAVITSRSPRARWGSVLQLKSPHEQTEGSP